VFADDPRHYDFLTGLEADKIFQAVRRDAPMVEMDHWDTESRVGLHVTSVVNISDDKLKDEAHSSCTSLSILRVPVVEERRLIDCVKSDPNRTKTVESRAICTHGESRSAGKYPPSAIQCCNMVEVQPVLLQAIRDSTNNSEFGALLEREEAIVVRWTRAPFQDHISIRSMMVGIARVKLTEAFITQPFMGRSDELPDVR
jgi:hypothetical protein